MCIFFSFLILCCLRSSFKNGIDYWIWFHNNNNNIIWAWAQQHTKTVRACACSHRFCANTNRISAVFMYRCCLKPNAIFSTFFLVLRTLSATTSVCITRHHIYVMSVKQHSMCMRVVLCVCMLDPNRENDSVQSSNEIYEIFVCCTHNDLPHDPISSKTENVR